MFISYLIPYAYFLRTRLKGKVQKISWVFVYFVPAIVLFNYFAPLNELNNIFAFVASVLLVNYVYENGYIENDLITTKKESEPTLRIGQQEADKIVTRLKIVYISRFFVSCLLLLLFYVATKSVEKIFILLAVLLTMQLLYFWYNRVRSRVNLFLILPLSYLRFYGFILPFVSLLEYFIFIVFTFLLYPASKFLEFTRQERYGFHLLSRFVGNVDLFRVRYYLFLLMFISVLCFFSLNPIIFTIWFVTLFYFLYRSLTFIMINKLEFIRLGVNKHSKSDYRK